MYIFKKKKISDNCSFITNITQLSTSVSDKINCLSELAETKPPPTPKRQAFLESFTTKDATNDYSNPLKFIRLNSFVVKGQSGDEDDLAHETLV